MRFNPKTIYCEKCSRKVATWDGKSSANIEVKCRNCNVLVVFRPANRSIETKSSPKRVLAGAMRFY